MRRTTTYREVCSGTPAGSSYGSQHFSFSPDPHAALELLNALNHTPPRALPSPSPPLVLYGGGNLGRLAFTYFKAVDVPVLAVVDQQAEKLRSDPFWSESDLVAPSNASYLLKQNPQLVVCVATTAFTLLVEILKAEGWTNVVPFYDLTEAFRDKHPLGNGWTVDTLDSEDIAAVANVLSLWGDDVSRAHHIQFLAWHMRREEWRFDDAPVTGADRFFIQPVIESLGTEDVFLDGGAHHGSVTAEFVRRTNGRFASIVMIEPDPVNREVLERSLSAYDPIIASRIVQHSFALDAQARESTFHSGYGFASRLGSRGQTRLQTRTIDSLGLSPSFIKLHLEGGELGALRGAVTTLRTHRPVVAVTAYHNEDGIWRIPQFLMQNLEDYRFLLRLHSWHGTGAVVYAIPLERR